ncbi:hypothetical protein OD91_1191 [Lutibacter sp. Hel_I_33_5]|uniref:hypothetical protein n=1 Tax=Lutibacter sp. Hel_I_33_5 TaxID=1566289 RepID=UPI0011A2377F|nr:hypothetical protein [Lutibacter sp. Hel_I_33_5]TVZ55917.1 hypothetical protein OD91_1191 [Lutibacter sp. Hel_I_33_5]
MKKIYLVFLFTCSLMFSQQGKIFIETNFNTFSHSNLSSFSQEFKNDLSEIPLKLQDDFSANIGFTIGYTIIESDLSIFASYNATGGKLSYSDYSGVIRLEQPLNAISLGGMYLVDLDEFNTFKLGFKGFAMYSSLEVNSYSKIGNNVNQDSLSFNSFDLGVGASLIYEYPISFFYLRANVGFDLVFGNKLIFSQNNEAHLINNSNEDVKTGWSGFRSGLGIEIPID